MAEIIIMPKLGYNMDKGKLIKWCFAPGDTIRKGEVLFEIETDKTIMPVEATAEGTLLATLIEEGTLVDVFTPICAIGAPGDDYSAALNAAGGTPPAVPVLAAPVLVSQTQSLGIPVGDIKLTPKAKKLVKDEGIDISSLSAIQGTGYQGGITDKDIKATPLARKIAQSTGADISAATATGAGGKVTKADIEAIKPDTSSDDKKILSRTPYGGVRKIIGERLLESKRSAPHIYFTDSVDTTNLTALRSRLNEVAEVKIAVSDLLTLAASKALGKYPQINSSLSGQDVVVYKSINIGTAVAGNNGLIVPVVRNVQEKSLTQITKESRDLVARAKEGRLGQQEYSGGTFTISNLGMFGIENFTAIINPPEAAILAVSSVRKKAVVISDENGDDSIAIRPIMNIQLTVDHRLIDGLLAAQFIGHIKMLLENPMLILI